MSERETIKLAAASSKKEQQLLKFQAKGGSMNLFPTVCFRREHTGSDIDAMNEELRELVLKQEKSGKSSKINSIKGGYHSDIKFFEQDHQAVKQLSGLIEYNFKQYIKDLWRSDSSEPFDKVWPFKIALWGWSVLLREGGFSAPHLHPNANISGVYYVTGNIEKSDIPNAGHLALCDPRTRAHVWPIRNNYETIKIPPKPGSMVMFPSWMEHYVVPFRGNDERISIAFNIALDQKARSSSY